MSISPDHVEAGLPIKSSTTRISFHSGPRRSVFLPKVSSSGGGAISASRDGERCVVVGRESMRILRIFATDEKPVSEPKYAVGQGGYRVEASRNMFVNSSSKMDGAFTDVLWCRGTLENKIVTSSRNGELALWDLQKTGSSKFERKKKGHTRAVNKISYNEAIPYCCTTASSDGYLRLWDFRDFQRTATHIHHAAPVRSSVFSPFKSESFCAITGLDNGNINRWDLRQGPKGLLDWIPLAHIGPVLSLDWRNTEDSGWLASAGFDRSVKVWEYPQTSEGGPSPGAIQPHGTKQPSYTLHASFPVRRVTWRPGYDTELAIASNNEAGLRGFGSSSSAGSSHGKDGSESANTSNSSPVSGTSLENTRSNASATGSDVAPASVSESHCGDKIEVWDVRRSWLAKWSVSDNQEGGVTGLLFADPQTLWVHHPSGAFSQIDMRFCDKPIYSMPRSAVTWSPVGSLSFAVERSAALEIPYDDGEINDEMETRDHCKRLGSESYIPTSQAVGTLFSVLPVEDWDCFASLARGYRLEGAERSEICAMNAEVAFTAGDENVARIWLILKDLLVDAAVSKLPVHRPPHLPHSASAPAGIPIAKPSSPHRTAPRSSSSEPQRRSSNSPKKGVPPPSPRPPPSPLATTQLLEDAGQDPKKITSPNGMRFRNQSASVVLPANRPRRNSLRRISLSTLPTQDDRLLEQSNISLAKPRRVPIGEGALDDSSSSDESNKVKLLGAHIPYSVKNGRSSSMSSYRDHKGTVSSPLAREENQPEDLESASPFSSSDGESDVSKASTKPMKGTRSRSSTFASIPPRRKKKMSQKYEHHDPHKTLSAARESKTPASQPGDFSLSSQQPRRRSQGHSMLGTEAPESAIDSDIDSEFDAREFQFLQRNDFDIRQHETVYRELAWSGIREGFETMLNEGNIQMCATMSIIAQREIGVSHFDLTRLVDAYIDLLSRLRLHSMASYVRKYSGVLERASLVQTTMYSACSKCCKPILKAVASVSHTSDGPRKGFNFCSHCKQSTTKCAICRLPVRAALFVCSVCMHGGHQDCYRKYYLNRPASRFSPTVASKEGTSINTRPVHDAGETWGHACAAGCGHICWLLER